MKVGADEWLTAYSALDDRVTKELWMEDLRSLRKRRGLSLEALGYMAGIDGMYIVDEAIGDILENWD